MGKAPSFFQGVIAPIVTPFIDDELDVDNLQRNVQMWLTSPLDGFVALGSTGEAQHLTFEEKKTVIKAVVDSAEERPVLAGTGCQATRETIELTKAAADCGAQAALVLTPHYFRGAMKDDVLIAHFEAVADAAPIPILLYNIPQNTGVDMSIRAIAELAQHPNIVGIKDSSGNYVKLQGILAATPDDFAVFTGSAPLLLAALLAGARGGILALANAVPWECCEVVQHFREGRLDEAAKLQRRLSALSDVVVRYGIPGIKGLLTMVGYAAGEPRRPLQPLSQEGLDDIRAVLQDVHLLGC